jgi:hypothetical protein
MRFPCDTNGCFFGGFRPTLTPSILTLGSYISHFFFIKLAAACDFEDYTFSPKQF